MSVLRASQSSPFLALAAATQMPSAFLTPPVTLSLLHDERGVQHRQACVVGQHVHVITGLTGVDVDTDADADADTDAMWLTG